MGMQRGPKEGAPAQRTMAGEPGLVRADAEVRKGLGAEAESPLYVARVQAP
jgi:hypothetical protein